MSNKMTNKERKPFSISQNFLTGSRTIGRLLNLTNININDYVIEIGAGKGHITKALAKRAGTVDAYEIDSDIYHTLKEKLTEETNVTVLNRDFLLASMPQKHSYKIFSNIPFSITTEIVRKIMSCENLPQEIWLIMEKGAAMRFCGKPGESLLSLQIKPFYTMRIEYYFKRTDFHPMPSVDVVLLHFHRKLQPDIMRMQRRAYNEFIRYTLKYGLYGKKAVLTPRQISNALRLAGLPLIERSGTMLYVQWLCLFRYYYGNH